MISHESDVKQYPCPSCGAELEFNPEKAQLKCIYCGHQELIPDSNEEVEERCYEQHLSMDRVQIAALSETALEVSCSDCGANITFEPPQVAGSCPFCGSNIVAQPKLAEPTIAPEAIIPFTIGRKKARQNLQEWLKELRFVPKELKQLAQLEKIRGVYLPFWTYDAFTASDYRGERGEYYYETETYTETNEDGEEETHTREVRHTSWYSVCGHVERFFDDVLVSGTHLIDNLRLCCSESWHLKESLRPYNPSYLAGFEAQRSQIDLEEGFEKAKKIVDNQITCDIIDDIGGDEQRINHVSTSYDNITFKHIFLPVWLTSYRYRDKQYQVIINGHTGQVIGDRPDISFKFTLTVLVAIAIIIALIVVFSGT